MQCIKNEWRTASAGTNIANKQLLSVVVKLSNSPALLKIQKYSSVYQITKQNQTYH